MNKPDKKPSTVKRRDSPLNEAVHQWLTPLLDSYNMADKGIRKEQKKGRQLASARGCSQCCKTHKDIPVLPLELVGITWLVTEKNDGEVGQKLKEQLAQHRDIDACPLLVGDTCSIHPMHPLASRYFHMLGKPCAESEDVFHRCRQDVLTPVRKYQQEGLLLTLPFYGDTDSKEQTKQVECGAMNKQARHEGLSLEQPAGQNAGLRTEMRIDHAR